LMTLALGTPADSPECRNTPSRVSDSYWAFVDACGCANLDPPSTASPDYARFLTACSRWRERNPQINVIVTDTRTADSTLSTDQTRAADPPECRNSPSRASGSYWTFIEACGCANLDPPSKTSPIHGRFLKACSQWRERNRSLTVIVPSQPSPAAKPKN